VEGGRVVRVLHAGGGPQGALHVGALRQVPGAGLLEDGVGAAGVGDAGPAPQRQGLLGADLLETAVHLDVETRDEEGGDGVDPRDVVAGLGRLLHAGAVGGDDLAVAGDGEDQGDVDGDALGQGVGDRRQGLGGGRDLDHDVRAVDAA